MVYERVVPYFTKEVLPLINKGENILIVAHGNSLRSLVKYIEDISNEEITNIEFDFNEIIIFNLDEKGKCLDKKVDKVSLA
jgi:2,3-bisphosphoglycerate-dependent phosphoglycerate mutase